MAIQFTTLGCYGVYPPPQQACSSYLFNTEEGGLIIDMGSGSFNKLITLDSSVNVNTVILTHLHFDHIVDAMTLSYYLQSKKRKVKLVLPQTPTEIYSIFLGMDSFELVTLNEEFTMNIGGMHITAKKSAHSVETYSIIMSKGSDRLVYTSDTTNYWAVTELLKGATQVIGDAGVLQILKNPSISHITVAELAMATPKSAKLYLGHLTYGNEAKILQEAKIYHEDTVLLNE